MNSGWSYDFVALANVSGASPPPTPPPQKEKEYDLTLLSSFRQNYLNLQ